MKYVGNKTIKKPIEPKVSVIVVSYNQKKYIRDALDGFVAQQTNFPFEVIIGDDCSTDGTQDIIIEYAQKYSFINPVLRKKNLGIMPNFIDTLKKAKGVYIAICEGDDYWTSSDKLQRQVDFMEDHPDYALCFHPVRVQFEHNDKDAFVFPVETDGFTTKKLLRNNFIQTNSVVYRRQDYTNMPTDIMPGDWYLHLYHAQFGKIGFINKIMAVYRRHPGGVWWNQHDKPQLIWQEYGNSYLKLLHEILILYGNDLENRKIINDHIAGSYEAIATIKPQDGADSVAIHSIGELPEEAWEYVKRLMVQVEHYSKLSVHLQAMLDREALHHKQRDEQDYVNEQKSKQLSYELNNIKSSKSWKVASAMRRVYSRLGF